MAERKAVTNQMARRYARARKGEKGRILDRLCAPHRLGPPAMIGEGEDHHRPRGRPLEPIQRFLRPGRERRAYSPPVHPQGVTAATDCRASGKGSAFATR